MRDDQAFIGDLRAEINQSQQRRHEYIAAKLIFISGLLGLGSLSLGNLATRHLLFIVPVVAFAYDLYTLGEDYGIKRAATFIRFSRATPPQEALWEKLVPSRRDPLSSIAGPLTSVVALGVAAVGLFPPATNAVIYSSWVALSAVLIVSLWYFRRKLVAKLEGWEEEIKSGQERLYAQIPGPGREGQVRLNPTPAAAAVTETVDEQRNV
jgi:hypothetical protein